MEKPKLVGRSILIVDCDLFDAIELQDTFCQEGARVMTAYSSERALQHAERSSLSAAMIDLSIGPEVVGSLCRHLRERKVPFVFYGNRIPSELGEWVDVQITKPAAYNKALEVVANLLGASSAQSGRFS